MSSLPGKCGVRSPAVVGDVEKRRGESRLQKNFEHETKIEQQLDLCESVLNMNKVVKDSLCTTLTQIFKHLIHKVILR